MGGGIQFISLSADAEFILQCKYGAGYNHWKCRIGAHWALCTEKPLNTPFEETVNLYKYLKRRESFHNVDCSTVDICSSFAWYFSRSTGKMNKQCVAFIHPYLTSHHLHDLFEFKALKKLYNTIYFNVEHNILDLNVFLLITFIVKVWIFNL